MGRAESTEGHDDETAKTILVSVAAAVCSHSSRVCLAHLASLARHQGSAVNLFIGKPATHTGNLGTNLGIGTSRPGNSLSRARGRHLTHSDDFISESHRGRSRILCEAACLRFLSFHFKRI